VYKRYMSICKIPCHELCNKVNERDWTASRTVHLAKCGELQYFMGKLSYEEFNKSEDYAASAMKSFCEYKAITSKGGRKRRTQKRRNTKKKNRRNHKK
jgi:hypothetical protein